MSNIIKQNICKRQFNNTIDITDPSYEQDVWCRLNNIEIIPGEYTCSIWTLSNGRIAKAGIYYNGITPNYDKMELIDAIGVDVAIAGFFNSPKKDYSNVEWDIICKMFDKNDYANTNEGFMCRSGYGDGSYNVYGYKINDNEPYIAIEIIFIDLRKE